MLWNVIASVLVSLGAISPTIEPPPLDNPQLELREEYEGTIFGCYQMADAVEVAELPFNAGVDLMVAKSHEAKCARYDGKFTVLELIEKHREVWIYKVRTSPNPVVFYLLYNKPSQRATGTGI